MFRIRMSSIGFLLLIVIIISANFSISAEASEFSTESLKHIKWRAIGPAAFGGRIDDIEAVPGKPNIIFIAAASGGIFRSIDNGTTWKAVFDEEGSSLTIGDIAIAPSDPNIVWAGTGESNNRQSSSWGDGVYKSLDGGEIWTNMGLKDTHHIGRVLIHPQNPDVVYVAALGHLWGPNPERGIFRTKDSGKTWEKVLYINEDTGFTDLAIEENGRVLYAAAYQRRRRGWGYVGGGPYSGLYRSLDGGDTWEKLFKGLPHGDTGRIGIALSPSHPHIVYAIIQHSKGGVFRSENRGKTWTRRGNLPYPLMFSVYFCKMRVDPQNPDKIWDLGYALSLSLDGGKTFTSEGTWENIHTDHHALWINPNNPDHLLLGGDGGLYISYSGSRTWDFIDNLPISQFYSIGIDTRDPYWIYGGAQDHGAFGLPSRTDSRLGITNSDMVLVAFGDAFHCVVDPKDPNIIYTENQEGRLVFKNMKTHEERIIRPIPDSMKEVYRFNWKCPLVMSHYDSRVLYYGGNKIFKTSDQGHSWEVISPDLTKNQDWKKLPVMGMERTRDTLALNYGVAHYGTITSLSESPVQEGLIYAGTDDGIVQVTKDGGKSWDDLTKGFRLSESRWVSCVLASHHGAGRAYVCFDGHWDDDFAPYVFKTEDFGKTWKSISGDMPDGMVVNDLEEHPRNPNLLFAGTEFGLFISINSGRNWVLARGNLPRVPVDDIIVNARDNDLILGTHGRGFFILDDIRMLEDVNEGVLSSEAYLFPSRMATQYFETRVYPFPAHDKFRAPNPDYGVLITYYLKNDPASQEEGSEKKSKVEIIILDKDGKVIRKLKGPDEKGFNRVNWDLRYPLSFDPAGTSSGYYEPKKGPSVLPGEYIVKLIARGQEMTQKVKVRLDPRIKVSPQALQAKFEASVTVNGMAQSFVESRKVMKEMEGELKRIQEILKNKEDIPEEINTKIKNISQSQEKIRNNLRTDWYGMEFAIMDLTGQLEASTYPPTQAQIRTIKFLLTKLEENIENINILLTQEFPDLQKLLNSKGIRLFVSEPVKLLKH